MPNAVLQRTFEPPAALTAAISGNGSTVTELRRQARNHDSTHGRGFGHDLG